MDISKKLFSIEKELRYVKNEIENHKGDIGKDVHGLPNNGEAGFMPYDQYLNNTYLFSSRKYLAQNTDIFELSPGFYYGYRLKNLPPTASTTALAVIDVTIYSDDRLKIVYTECSTNLTWVKTINVPGSATDFTVVPDWRKVYTVKTLFNGSLSDSSTQTVSEAFTNFSELEIVFKSSAGDRYLTRIPVATGSYLISGIHITSSGFIELVQASFNILSSTTFSLGSQLAYNINAASASFTQTTAFSLLISTVRGIK